MRRAETRFARSDDAHIAYQVVGSGPVDVVMDFHAFAGNVDLIWDEPDWGPLLVGVSEFARLIVHDRRGSGASTRNVPPPNLETRAADLLANESCSTRPNPAGKTSGTTRTPMTKSPSRHSCTASPSATG